MVNKRKVSSDKLEFVKRGHRVKSDCGLYFNSECGNYMIYKSDRLCGHELRPIKWIAFQITDGVARTIVTDKRYVSRKAAIRACEKFDKSRT